MDTTVDVILDALTRAAKAHGEHERELGRPDPDWPTWYAAHMAGTLSDNGYVLTRSPA